MNIINSVHVFDDDVVVYCEETYEDYDPRFCCNGGSYYQPTFKLKYSYAGHSYELLIDDSSCGDFGSCIDVQLRKDECVIASAHYGSMEPEREYSDFVRGVLAHDLALFVSAEVAGYRRIPYMEG